MNKEQVIKLLEVIKDSISSNPNQFSFEINTVGTNAINSAPGGIGLSVSTMGGGPGSNTIGYQSTLNGTEIQIAQGRANQKISSEISDLIESLNSLIEELRKESPDQIKLESFFQSLIKSWVPDVIKQTVSTILAMVGYKFSGLDPA